MSNTISLDWSVREIGEWTFARAITPDKYGNISATDLLRGNTALPCRHKAVVTEKNGTEIRFEAMEGEPVDDICSGECTTGTIDIDEIQKMMDETGWTGTIEADDTIRIASDANGCPVIRGEIDKEGHFTFSVRFSTTNETDETGFEARALFMLRLGAEFRLVVPVFRDDQFRLEVSFPTPGPTQPNQVNDALGALTAAVQTSRHEFAALGEPEVAAAYLSQYEL